MKFLFVFAHKDGKFSRDVLKEVGKHFQEKKHEVRIVDLYKIKFNPVNGRHDFEEANDLTKFDYPMEQKAAGQRKEKTFSKDILAQMELVKWCDSMFFFFPLTNYNIPTILKGWFDRIYAYYFAFGGLNSLSPRKFLFFCEDTKGIGKEQIDKFFSNLYQLQNVSGVRNQGTYVYEKSDDEKAKKGAVDHVKHCYSFKNRFFQNFNFPRLKALLMFFK